VTERERRRCTLPDLATPFPSFREMVLILACPALTLFFTMRCTRRRPAFRSFPCTVSASDAPDASELPDMDSSSPLFMLSAVPSGNWGE
jgi:hypothetical protein